MSRRLSPSDVEHVAQLARLALSVEEVEQLAEELTVILDHAQDVAALDLDGVPPTAHPVPLRNVLRPDAITPSLDRQEVLAQAPDIEDHRFRVPRILGEAP
jgi:aspartyl-tRNA(Asn)/glutamyl-tRNA(Gln) amidotransferase subunit C